MEEGHAPEILTGIQIDLSTVMPKNPSLRCYDPWKDQWTTSDAQTGAITLPPFSRSVVVRAIAE